MRQFFRMLAVAATETGAVPPHHGCIDQRRDVEILLADLEPSTDGMSCPFGGRVEPILAPKATLEVTLLIRDRLTGAPPHWLEHTPLSWLDISRSGRLDPLEC